MVAVMAQLMQLFQVVRLHILIIGQIMPQTIILQVCQQAPIMSQLPMPMDVPQQLASA